MKKLLALVLALVMTMSLVTISNAAFNDADKIDYKEAVDVMSTVGVLKGYTNGDFGAKDTLTRAQAAKIIAYLDLGETTADALVGTGTVFTDVKANNWAAGYIEYCANAGYVAGVGDKKFAPDEKVTGYQFAKMLLAALGYDANIEGMTGADWQIVVAKLAGTNELFADMKKVYSVALTRDEAAKMAFNAIKATCVKYEGGTNVSTPDGTKVVINATRKEVTLDSYNYAGMDADAAGKGTQQLCEKLYGKDLTLTTSATYNDFKAPVSEWKYNNGSKIETVKSAKDADLTYYGEVKGGTIYADLGKPDVKEAKSWTDGASETDVKASIASNNETKFGGNGAVVEVYKTASADDGNTYRIIITNTYAAKVTKVTEAKGSDARKITLAGMTYETESYARDDVLLYTTANSKIQTVAKPEVVEGVYTSVKDNTNFVVSGTTYKYSAKFVDLGDGDKLAAYDKNDTNKVKFYLDAQGYCIAFAEVEVATNYGYVIATGAEGKYSTDKTYYAKLLLADGTKVDAELKNEAAYNAITDGDVVKYSVNSKNVYTLTKVGGAVTFASDDKVQKGQAALANTAYYVNDDTTFVLKDGDDYVAYKGVKNVPTFKYKDGSSKLFAGLDGSLAKFVYAEGVTLTSSSADTYAYVYKLASDAEIIRDASGSYYELSAVVNNELLTWKVDAGSAAVAKLKGLSGVAVIEKYSVDKDGFITDVTELDGATKISGSAVEAAKNGVLKLGSTYYAPADNIVVAQYDKSDEALTVSTVAGIDTDASATFAGYVKDGKLLGLIVCVD